MLTKIPRVLDNYIAHKHARAYAQIIGLRKLRHLYGTSSVLFLPHGSYQETTVLKPKSFFLEPRRRAMRCFENNIVVDEQLTGSNCWNRVRPGV